MPILVWDKVEDRRFESGLDRGALYLPDGTAVAWSGLTSVVEKFNRSTTPVYYEGRKISEIFSPGEFSATMKAITYPDEFIEFEGGVPMRRGVVVEDQPPKFFNLSYRTKIGNDLDGQDDAYKIHIIYNILAIPADKTYASFGDTPSLVEFEWDLVAVPEELPGRRPSAHIVADSRFLDPWLMEELERMLYGDDHNIATLPPLVELFTYIRDWCRVRVVDNGDGTWTVYLARDSYITELTDEGFFELNNVTATYLDPETYEFTSSVDLGYDILISIVDNGDGTWTATTDEDGLIEVDDEGLFTIHNANVVLSGPEMYRVSDTPKN